MSFNNWFKNNPAKILGIETESTDRFGKPITIIKGNLSLLSKIDVSESLYPVLRENAIAVDLESERNIEKSLKPSVKTNKKVIDTSTSSINLSAVSTSDLYTESEAFEVLNRQTANVSDEDIEVWVYYCIQNSRPIHPYLIANYKKAYTDSWLLNMLTKGFLCYEPSTNEYIPRVLYYQGNILDKIQKLRNLSFENELMIGEPLRERQLKTLLEVQPPMLSLSGDENYRLSIDPFSKFSKSYILNSGLSIYEEFKEWVDYVPAEHQLTTLSSWEIIHYGFNNGRHSNNTDPSIKLQMKLDLAIEIPNLMAKFLDELSHLDKQKIEFVWNLENNSFVDPDYNKIPLMFVFSKTFKNSKLSIRPEQREGVAFNEVKGTGVIGFDVGVGKTMTAILTFAQFMQSGRAFRPILVVPKPTYGKWIGEIRGTFDDKGILTGTGILPQYPINSFFNLSSKIVGEGLKVEENSITIVTFQGAKNLGFTDDYAEKFVEKVNLILDQGEDNASQRQKELQKSKGKTKVSEGQMNSTAFIDELKFDYLCMDEAHNANKIFVSVKGSVDSDGDRQKSRFAFSAGTPSLLSTKMFFLSQYVQENSNGNGNVQLLTATPFTNNPLNVYNIFALTNFAALKEYGIENVNTFFEKYVEVSVGTAVNVKQEIVEKEVIKSWKNKVALQKIMFGIINYKSAQDSPSVKRPNKVVLPLLSTSINGVQTRLPENEQILTILKQSDRQLENRFRILADLKHAESDRELSKKAPMLVAENQFSNNSLSPFIYEKIDPSEISPAEFVETSPKINTMMLVIDGINKWFDERKAPRSCQIVYCAIGVDYFPLMKEYMMSKLGYKKNVFEYSKGKYFDEVEILAGSGISDDVKEDLKEAFNDGIVKVIIGSSTIREGIDLQKRTSTLHSLWVDWNATDFKQLEGRCWRFGNMFDYVRIIQYLVQGGTDSFKFQKLEEKTARTNDIFDRLNQENILDVSDTDREEVKWALIDDIDEVVKQQVKSLARQHERQIAVLNQYLENYISFESELETAHKLELKFQEVANFAKTYNNELKLDLENKDIFEILKTLNRNRRSIDENILLNWSMKQNLRLDYIGYELKRYKVIKDKLKRMDDYSIKTTNRSIYEIDLKLEIENYRSKIIGIEQEIESIKSSENHERLFLEIQKERLEQDDSATEPEEVAKRILSLNDKVLSVISVKDDLTKVAPSVVELDKPADNSKKASPATSNEQNLQEYLTEYIRINKEVDLAATRMEIKAFELGGSSSSMGLVSDKVRADKEYQLLRSDFNKKFKLMQQMNKENVKSKKFNTRDYMFRQSVIKAYSEYMNPFYAELKDKNKKLSESESMHQAINSLLASIEFLPTSEVNKAQGAIEALQIGLTFL